MSKIIRPQGKTVVKILLEMDASGQIRVEATNPGVEDITGMPGVVPATTVMLVLSQSLTSVIQSLTNQLPGVKPNASPKKNNHDI